MASPENQVSTVRWLVAKKGSRISEIAFHPPFIRKNKADDKIHPYVFSINASKKLLGAIRHSLEKLNAESRKSSTPANKP